MKKTIVIGSRGSALALAQSEWVAEQMRGLCPDSEVRIEIISTAGDRIQDRPLAAIGGKGLFTQELETAMLDGSIDLAVHSMKDLPTELPEGLTLGATPLREDPRDAFVSSKWDSPKALPAGARVGTSSLRRAAQLRALRHDLDVVDLRGNVDTRVRKVRDGEVDAAILACAGLRRLGREADIAKAIPVDCMVPAVAQGALAIESREDDPNLKDALAQLTDNETLAEITAERTLLAELQGGCQVPLGALCRCNVDRLEMTAVVCSLDGTNVLRTRAEGAYDNPEDLGQRVAHALRDLGAEELIAALR
jgi:hydroxymethylbilane synthase